MPGAAWDIRSGTRGRRHTANYLRHLGTQGNPGLSRKCDAPFRVVNRVCGNSINLEARGARTGENWLAPVRRDGSSGIGTRAAVGVCACRRSAQAKHLSPGADPSASERASTPFAQQWPLPLARREAAYGGIGLKSLRIEDLCAPCLWQQTSHPHHRRPHRRARSARRQAFRHRWWKPQRRARSHCHSARRDQGGGSRIAEGAHRVDARRPAAHTSAT